MSDEFVSPEDTGQPAIGVGYEATVGSVIRRWVVVRHASVWHPPTDVFERDDTLIVLVEIAGMRHSDFSVTLQGQRLIIGGIRERATLKDCAYHQLEIPYGEFRTEVSLPWPVARDAVTATYRDGFLRVELPHAPTQKVQIVTVNDQDAPAAPESATESEE